MTWGKTLGVVKILKCHSGFGCAADTWRLCHALESRMFFGIDLRTPSRTEIRQPPLLTTLIALLKFGWMSEYLAQCVGASRLNLSLTCMAAHPCRYADVYYNLTGNRPVGHGDVSERKAFRDTHDCKSFKWYLDTITPYMFTPMPEHYEHFGKFRSVGLGECLNHDGTGKGPTKAPRLTDCNQNWGHALEWLETAFSHHIPHTLADLCIICFTRRYLTKDPFKGQLRHEASYGSRCLHVENEPPTVSLVRCYDYETGAPNLEWVYTDGQLRSRRHGTLCLFAESSSDLKMRECESVTTDDHSKWEFAQVQEKRV